MIDPAESIAFHASSPKGENGYVLLLERPGAHGRVRARRWSSPDYTADSRDEEREVTDLRAELARDRRRGWRFTLPPERILQWLEIAGSDPR